jgi:hypothetical protein
VSVGVDLFARFFPEMLFAWLYFCGHERACQCFRTLKIYEEGGREEGMERKRERGE